MNPLWVSFVLRCDVLCSCIALCWECEPCLGSKEPSEHPGTSIFHARVSEMVGLCIFFPLVNRHGFNLSRLRVASISRCVWPGVLRLVSCCSPRHHRNRRHCLCHYHHACVCVVRSLCWLVWVLLRIVYVIDGGCYSFPFWFLYLSSSFLTLFILFYLLLHYIFTCTLICSCFLFPRIFSFILFSSTSYIYLSFLMLFLPSLLFCLSFSSSSSSVTCGEGKVMCGGGRNGAHPFTPCSRPR